MKRIRPQWWSVSKDVQAKPAAHAFVSGSDTAMCGVRKNDTSSKITPSKMEESRVCQRCQAHIHRFELMGGA